MLGLKGLVGRPATKFVGLLEKYATVKCSPASRRMIKLEMRLQQLVTLVDHMVLQEAIPVHPFQLETMSVTLLYLILEPPILQPNIPHAMRPIA